jgi:phospholipid/cholesterol/gamma-HCH transport system substrate-binding protein
VRGRSKTMTWLAAFVVCAVAMTWMVYATLRRDVAGPTNTYSATFTDVSGLAPGDDVRVAGVRVGRVDDIDLVDTRAKVTFRIQRDQRLFTDTVASVTYQNAIGQRYLGLAKGRDERRTVLPDHGQIVEQNTTASLDISYMLNGFEPLFAQLDPEQVNNLTNALIDAFQGDSGAVVTLTAQASQLAVTTAGPDQVLGELVENLNALTGTLNGQHSNLQTMIRQTRGVMSDLAGRRDELVTSVGSINATVGRLATIVDNITPDAQEFISREPGFFHHGLNDGRERFAYMTANLPFLLKGLARVMQGGAYVDGYICDVDISLWQGLFHWLRAFVAWTTPGNQTKHSQICR